VKIFTGNLSFETTESDLRELFEKHGELESCKLITDRDTGRSRGFAFIEMDNSAADAAIKELNGMDYKGRNMKVSQAEDRKPNTSRGYR